MMKKTISIVMTLVMALTIFVIPTGAAYAEGEEDVINAFGDVVEPEGDAVVETEGEDVGMLDAMEYAAPDKPEVTVTETESSVTFKWTVKPDTEYRYSEDGGTTWQYVTDSSIDNVVKEGAAGTTFTFDLQAYIIVPEGTPGAVEVEGDYALLSETASATGTVKTPAPVYTAPAAPSITAMTPGLDNIAISWSTVKDADGYAYSRYSGKIGDNRFRDNGTSTSFKWTGLNQRVTKTFWVCAYKVVPEGTEGAIKLNPSNKLVLISKVVSKSATTTSSEKMTRKKKSRGYIYKYYNDAFGKGDLGTSYAMWSKVKNTKSKTKYLIAIDTKRNNVVIYKGKKGNWKVYKHVICSCGMPSHTTPHGTFKIFKRKPKFAGFVKRNGHVTKEKYTCWYATRFKGACFFHSTLYKYNSKSAHADRKLGDNRSHGCIRMNISDARWIYKNCKNGTAVVSSSYPQDCSFGKWNW